MRYYSICAITVYGIDLICDTNNYRGWNRYVVLGVQLAVSCGLIAFAVLMVYGMTVTMMVESYLLFARKCITLLLSIGNSI